MPTDIVADLKWRGLIQQTTDETQLAKWLNEGVRTLYAGFDPTADSLHVGHLMAVMILRRFQKAGHRPIALVGGATGMIGDPSGKSEERNLLSVETLRSNVAAMERQLRQFLEFDAGDNRALLLNNFDWMSRFSYLEFLRDIGKHFPVNVMLSKDSVKNRIERDTGISYTEFSYMLLQAYDFVYLKQQHGCELQVGGSDQWGNITAGIDLGRRMHAAQLFGMTCPLLTTSEGKKMGKTERGAVWLSPEKTSPYQFYQYWIKDVPDADVGKCLRFLTELSHEEIEALDASCAKEPQLRLSQKRLAEELTKLVHGEEGLASAQRATQLFFDTLAGAEIANLPEDQIGEIFADVPSKTLEKSKLDSPGFPVLDAFVEAGLAKSKGEARRTLEQGGVYINNKRQDDATKTLTSADLASATTIVLRSGKKKYALLRFE